MIAAIDSTRLAASNDKAAAAGQSQDPRFNQILSTAARHEPAKPLPRLERPGTPVEPQPRSVYAESARPRLAAEHPAEHPEPRAEARAERAAERPEPRAEGRVERRDEPEAREPEAAPASTATAKSASHPAKTAAAEGTEETGKTQDKDKALKPADAQTPSADELAGALLLPGVVLTAQDIIAQSNANSLAQRSINVQLGTAAYRMSPHSQTEAQFAAQAGAATPPGYMQPLDPGAALDGRNAIREPSKAPAGELKPEPVLVVDALAMVELSKQAQAARVAAANPHVAEAPEGSAQARNQILSQLVGQPATVPQVAAALQAMEPALKDVPKDAALPGKELHPKALDGAPSTSTLPADAAAGAGGMKAAQSVDQPRALPTQGHGADTRMVDKVVQEAKWLLRNNHQEVTIRMEPEHLGNLKLHVTQKDGAMHVEMTVDTAAAKHLLDANLGQLRERFAQEHLGQGQMLQVDVRHGGNSEFAQQFGRQGGEAAGAVGTGRALASEEPAAAAPRAAWSNSNVSISA